MSEIEIIVRVHDTDRPLSRAIDSILECSRASVLVVAHGISRDLIPLPDSNRIKVVEVPDGWGFPGYSSNGGVAATSAPFIGFLDSDDYFESGALDALYSHLLHDGADGVLIPRVQEGRERSLLPVTTKNRELKAGPDRLFYYTAPFGLYKREVFAEPEFAFDEDVVTGEDMRVSARLWTSNLSISFYPDDPAYVVTGVADNRATSGLTVSQQLDPLNKLLEEEWLRNLPPQDLTAWVIKTIRVNILSGILKVGTDRTAEERTAIEETFRRLLELSPQALEVFSMPDRKILDEALGLPNEGQGSDPVFLKPVLERLPKKPWWVFHRESNMRRVLAGKAQSLLSRFQAPSR